MNNLLCEGGRITRENDIAHKALSDIHNFIEDLDTDNDGNLCKYFVLYHEKTVIKRGRNPIEKAVLKCFKAIRKYYTELNDLELPQLMTFDDKRNLIVYDDKRNPFIFSAEGPSNEKEL